MIMMMKRIPCVVVLALGAAVLFSFACSDSATVVDPVAGGSPQGQVVVKLHDQAGPGIARASVTISALELRNATRGAWVVVEMAAPETVDLLLLTGGFEATLATASVPVAEYDAMQITLDGAEIELTDGTIVTLAPPALPVAVAGFPMISVSAEGTITITLDFPVGTSFRVNGSQVTMTPEIQFDAGP